MQPDDQTKARAFYRDVLDAFGNRYPRFLEEGMGMFKVLHAFEDKIPLIDVLLERDLLLGVVLKKSSSEMQGPVVADISRRLEAHDVLMARSETVYANAIPSLSRRAAGRRFVIGDHGGYYAHALLAISRHFGEMLAGVTEHTLNGSERVLHQFDHINPPVRYFSTAKSDLKERSDRDIAQAIAREIMHVMRQAGKTDATILLIGYGTMGFHAARALQAFGSKGEIIVADVKAKKRAFAVQDGHLIAKYPADVLPAADMIVLATDVIKGKNPVLDRSHFGLLKRDACIASMTSLDDEARKDELVADRSIVHVGAENAHGVYVGPKGNRFMLLQDGRPANAGLSDGGAGAAIHMVEAAGLAGAFAAAQKENADTLADTDADVISDLWIRHFGHGAIRPAP